MNLEATRCEANWPVVWLDSSESGESRGREILNYVVCLKGNLARSSAYYGLGATVGVDR